MKLSKALISFLFQDRVSRIVLAKVRPVNNAKTAMVLGKCHWNKGKGHSTRIKTDDIYLFWPLTPAIRGGLWEDLTTLRGFLPRTRAAPGCFLSPFRVHYRFLLLSSPGVNVHLHTSSHSCSGSQRVTPQVD